MPGGGAGGGSDRGSRFGGRLSRARHGGWGTPSWRRPRNRDLPGSSACRNCAAWRPGLPCRSRPIARSASPARRYQSIPHAWWMPWSASLPEAHIELLDYSRQAVPEGQFHFDPRALRGSPTAAIWPGWVEFAAHRRFTVWAKVKLNLKARRVLAVDDLVPGRPIPAAAVAETLVDALPSAHAVFGIGHGGDRALAAGRHSGRRRRSCRPVGAGPAGDAWADGDGRGRRRGRPPGV